MDRQISRRGLALAAVLCLLASLLTGCAREPIQTTIFAMDTVMTLTIHGPDQEACQQAMDRAVEELYALEGLLSVTRADSDIYQLNHAQGAETALHEETAALLAEALALCGRTGGALDLTAYPAVAAWGFTSGEYRVPDDGELAALAAAIDYTQVELDVETLSARLPQGVELDLGAVVKGYAGDLLAQLVADYGVSGALLNLGQSTIQAVGNRADGDPWRVALQDPEGDGYLAMLALSDGAVGTSGGYQRYFEADGQRYWHILDPDTAAPARSGLLSVTVVGPSGMVCDGLSTALFVMGLEEGTQFWRDNRDLDIEVIFVCEDGSIALTAGLEDSFTLAQGMEGREVTVLS